MNHGRVFMSLTLIHGTFMLGTAVLSFRNHLERVDQAIILVEEMTDQVKKEFSVLKKIMAIETFSLKNYQFLINNKERSHGHYPTCRQSG